MRTHLVTGIALAGFAALGAFTGCGAEVDPSAGDEATATVDEALHTDGGFVTIRRDLRKCLAPMCGGYFVRYVNDDSPAFYVSGLELTGRALAQAEQILADIRSAPDGDVVLFGSLGPAEPRFHTRAFLAVAAWRGLPGVDPARGDAYYRVGEIEASGICPFQPCKPVAAVPLNHTARITAAGVVVASAAPPHVQVSWLEDRVVHHGALVAGRIDPARRILGASQVFVRLPELPGPCPRLHHACPVGKAPAYTRNAERCLEFAACIDVDGCLRPPEPLFACLEGYTDVRWVADGITCSDRACDPTFTRP